MDSTLIHHYTSSIRVYFLKLVNLVLILTLDRVFSTISQSRLGSYLEVSERDRGVFERDRRVPKREREVFE